MKISLVQLDNKGLHSLQDLLVRKNSMGVRSMMLLLPSVQVSLRIRSLQVPVVVVARDGPGPPGRSAGVYARRSGGHVEDPDS